MHLIGFQMHFNYTSSEMDLSLYGRYVNLTCKLRSMLLQFTNVDVNQGKVQCSPRIILFRSSIRRLTYHLLLWNDLVKHEMCNIFFKKCLRFIQRKIWKVPNISTINLKNFKTDDKNVKDFFMFYSTSCKLSSCPK